MPVGVTPVVKSGTTDRALKHAIYFQYSYGLLFTYKKNNTSVKGIIGLEKRSFDLFLIGHHDIASLNTMSVIDKFDFSDAFLKSKYV